jgi:hypothetical protein
MSKSINVKYLEKYVDDDGILIPNWKTKQFSTESYKVYDNVQYKLAKLDKCATLLFHYLCEQMDSSNNIVHVQALRKGFIAHANKNLGHPFEDDTVKKAFSKLVKQLLIINYDVKSDFTINPRHVFKGSEEQRKKLIQTLIKTFNKSQFTKSNYKKALGLD